LEYQKKLKHFSTRKIEGVLQQEQEQSQEQNERTADG